MDLQTHGPKKLTQDQLQRIEPLIWGQKCKEITIKSLVEEMSDWWTQGWGWSYPINHTLENIKGDWTFKLSVLKIRQRIVERGFLEFLKTYPGFSHEERVRYLKRISG